MPHTTEMSVQRKDGFRKFLHIYFPTVADAELTTLPQYFVDSVEARTPGDPSQQALLQLLARAGQLTPVAEVRVVVSKEWETRRRAERTASEEISSTETMRVVRLSARQHPPSTTAAQPPPPPPTQSLCSAVTDAHTDGVHAHTARLRVEGAAEVHQWWSRQTHPPLITAHRNNEPQLVDAMRTHSIARREGDTPLTAACAHSNTTLVDTSCHMEHTATSQRLMDTPHTHTTPQTLIILLSALHAQHP